MFHFRLDFPQFCCIEIFPVESESRMQLTPHVHAATTHAVGGLLVAIPALDGYRAARRAVKALGCLGRALNKPAALHGTDRHGRRPQIYRKEKRGNVSC